MRNTIVTTALSSFTFLLAPNAEAAVLPAREVRINAERLAALPPVEQERVLEIQDRLQELLATDRSSLEKAQRNELRSEWKELKSEMEYYNRNGNVVYISTGALIIIVLLLIIIL
jgi:hypothetical protein